MLKNVNQQYLKTLQDAANNARKGIVVSALIVNKDKIFVQKRSANRKIFPNAWDVVGGHLEQGENIAEALEREIFEETAWKLKEILGHINSFDWEADGQEKREFAFIVYVDGDLDNPVIEKDKHSDYCWLEKTEIEVLADNKKDLYIHDLVKKAFELL